jgi:hypothetical protein
MPYRDGTGPNGQGTRTGRGMGNCTGQGGTGRGAGRGLGRGGRSHGCGLGSTNQRDSWIENLQTAIEKLTERLDKINKE